MRYSTFKYPVTLKPGLGSLKVIENYLIQSGTHDFLLTFHSNHRPISHRFRDKRRFQSKIATFSHPVYLYLYPPLKRFPFELGIGARGQKNRMMWLPDGRESFKIGLSVLIQYWRVTTSQPSFHSKYRASKRRVDKNRSTKTKDIPKTKATHKGRFFGSRCSSVPCLYRFLCFSWSATPHCKGRVSAPPILGVPFIHRLTQN